MLASKLNIPDDWSFSTNGKVWINQNWGADVILYAAHTHGHETGLLAIIFLLLALTGLFLILAMRRMEIPLPFCLLTSAICIAAINVFAILRPNLFTLTLLPLELWLLYQSLSHTWIVWFAVLVILCWANLHGGFLFGLGMLWLHATCTLLPALFKEKGKSLKQHWQLSIAAVAALLLAAMVNPFGLHNLTLPLLMTRRGVWNVMLEWQPILKTELLGSFMVGIIGFLFVLGITLLLLFFRLAHTLVGRKPKIRPHAASPAGNFKYLQSGFNEAEDSLIFDIVLALVSIVMAVLSNRFLAIALLTMAPTLAFQLRWLAGTFHFCWLTTTRSFSLILIFSILLIYDNARSYDPRNPLSAAEPSRFTVQRTLSNTSSYPAAQDRLTN